ncbi:hypothetical protein H2200_008684 [Cladophialophora chaetospira]|uniref:AB hydrolase-1 domain-containing protein n=1 Tax=Cladophialophora chaetospira TaxID=386627 RepID=A0AA38X4P3_9EURO|nr:hypothetical protein H2200_008684 [Cladophialophora chaetospira]
MSIDSIDVWSDPRVKKLSASVRGVNYGYWLAEPESTAVRASIFLVHGYPDLSAAWRKQIPMLLDLGLRVVAIDCIGYGRTDAPSPIKLYTFRRVSDDIAELARQMGLKNIILGGHDWGGMVVQRCAQYHPQLVTHVFSISTPYFPIESTYTPEGGMQFENFARLAQTNLLTPRELDYYAAEFSRNGLWGPNNWYRTREVNFSDELDHFLESSDGGELKPDPGIEQNILYIATKRDRILTPEMCEASKKFCKNHHMKVVDADHWALWENPVAVNQAIKDWLEKFALDAA